MHAAERLRLEVRGAVQGVGFRPWVHALADGLGLRGFVRNTGAGARIELEGERERLDAFQARFPRELPPHAFLSGCECVWLPPAGYARFEILESDPLGAGALPMPDIATCAECLREMRDPAARRFGYPFTNCSHCGPRYSILESLPYDRARTSMRRFEMCEACRAEFEDPEDRRFHAQPIACPRCGPQLKWLDAPGGVARMGADALGQAVDALRNGAIVAIKGLGGFHLCVDACNQGAVAELRARKAREEKPFALLVPTLDFARRLCEIDALEARALTSPEAPIVLCRRKSGGAVSGLVAPGNPCLGLMLPHTPLQHLLMDGLGRPCVATSGNCSGEAICFEHEDAFRRLGALADGFLLHDREIVRPIDDSVVRVACGRETMIRRARGWAPLPVGHSDLGVSVLAVGAHQKNTVAVAAGRSMVLSQHVGDLDADATDRAFRGAIGDLCTLFGAQPEWIACDLHPDYASTREAQARALPLIRVQHHYAHVLACMAEHNLQGAVLGVAWDGSGLGDDGTLWGGEFLAVDDRGFRRLARFKPFPLPGGEAAAREPRRSALGLLYAAYREEAFALTACPPLSAFSQEELRLLGQMLKNSVHAPLTSSAGRLFDAVASLCGLRQRTGFEGQAAMDLEYCAIRTGDRYGFTMEADAPDTPWTIALALRELMCDLSRGSGAGVVSGKFHRALVEVIAQVAARAGLPRVVLSGGCFQNVRLLEGAVERLRRDGFQVFWPQCVPANDGGIALGQLAAAARHLKSGSLR